MTEADDIAADFVESINEVLIENGTLKRSTSTTDPAGMQDDSATTSIPITMRIMPLSDAQRNLLDIGQDITGESIGYFLPTYTYLSITYTIAEGDIILNASSQEYRVQKIIQVQHLNTIAIYLKALLRRI